MTTSRYAVAGFVSGALLGAAVVLVAGGNTSCSTAKSQEEQNLELLRRFEEAYMKQDLKAFDELLAPNQVTHINGVTSTTNIDSLPIEQQCQEVSRKKVKKSSSNKKRSG